MNGSLQIKNNTYYVVTRIDKKQKWIKTGIPAKKGNKRKAETKMHEILQLLETNPKMFDKIDFTVYAWKCIEQAKNNLEAKTFEEHKRILTRHILPYFDGKNLAVQDITYRHLEGYYTAKLTDGRLDGKEGGLTRGSVKRHSAVFALIFNQAMRDGLISVNPCTLAAIPRINETPKHVEFLCIEDCRKLLDITKGTPLHDMIYISFLYGLRRSEMLGIRWVDVDFLNDTLTIRHTVVRGDEVIKKDTTKTKSSNRTYPLLPEIKEMLIRIKREQAENKSLLRDAYIGSPYVFVRPNGAEYYPDYPSQTLTKVLAKNDMPHIRWHDLRHSCASMLLDQGWAMKDISDWLGHSGIAVTMNVYGHLSVEHKRQAAAGLVGVLD